VSGLRYPVIDARRVSALRDALLRMAPSLVPEWSALGESGTLGKALLEIAGRLGEHTTRRLDQTPRRDALAFFDTLDIPPAAPQAAEATLVFSLVDKRQTQVLAPARTQVATPGRDGQEVIFETVAPFAISPAKLGDLIGVDAAADRVERAPGGVTVAVPPEGPEPLYRVASFTNSHSTNLQVAPTVGLAQGDMIRLGDAVYRIAAIDGAILNLLDPLEAPAIAGELFTKASTFEAFDMRNLQSHAFYVGHAGLLNLEAAAKIVLDLAPDSLARKLGTFDIAYELWGTAGNDKEPAWHALDQLGASDNRLQLFKGWTGSVDELEVNGVKSRWLRASLQNPLAGGADPGLSASRIGLLVESDDQAGNDPADAAFEGSKTIAQAFHNNTPLPLASRFFPFGPEPQRFDIFSLAAPEALSKPDAKVTLHVTLVDATLAQLVMAIGAGAPPRAYGIGKNGKLQALAFEPDGSVRRMELGLPDTLPPEDEGQLSNLRSGADFVLQAVQFGQVHSDVFDLVVVADNDGRLWIASVRKAASGNEGFRIQSWRLLPKPPDGFPLGNIVLAPAKNAGVPLTAAFLFASGQGLEATAKPLQALAIDIFGVSIGDWKPVDETISSTPPPLTGESRLATVAGRDHPQPPAGPNIELVLIDSDGAVWRVEFDAVQFRAHWTPLDASGRSAALDVRPTAARYRLGQVDGFWFAAASAGDRSLFAMRDSGGGIEAIDASDDSLPDDSFFAQPGTALHCDPTTIEIGSGQPLTAALGTNGAGDPVALLWAHRKRLLFSPLQDAVSSSPSLLRPVPARGSPDVILSGVQESLSVGRIDRQTKTVDFELRDWIEVDSAGDPPHYIELTSGPQSGLARRLAGQPQIPGSATDNDIFDAGPRGTLADDYRLLAPRDNLPVLIGEVDNGNQAKFTLDQNDADTESGDTIVIEVNGVGSVHTFSAFDATTSPSTATLDPAFGGPAGPVSYVAVKETGIGTAGAANRGTLAHLPAEPQLPWQTALVFSGAADPKVQPIGRVGFNSGAWLLLPEWTSVPGDGQAELVSALALSSWTSFPFERSYQNPELSWEYFNGDGWRRLERTDLTGNLQSTGEITFAVPDDIATTDVAGQEDYWIRARLIGGDYGRAKYIVETNGNTQTITVDTLELRPPEIARIEATFELTQPAAPEHVLTENNLATLDQTQASIVQQAHFNLFEGLAALVEDQLDRALFLGFTKPIDVNPLSLCVDAAEQTGDGVLRADILGRDGWHRLTVDDETDALRRRGYLKLFINVRSIRSSLFGAERHWVRLRLDRGTAAWAPRVKGLYVNAARALQAKTIKQEILGSSLGEPGQSFPLSERPVLPETLELRVREVLSDEERAALERDLAQRSRLQGSTGKPPPAVATYPNIDGEWVLWRRVDSFVGLEGDARVFRFSPGDAICTFGDNRAGKIPPAGRDAIRAIIYQNGGGESGNVPAYSPMKLKSSLESLDEVVLPVDATGGVNAPGIDALVATSPTRLRHVSQALAIADFEALATASSPDIVRALCIEPKRPGDPIRVVIALRDGTPRPVPTLGRREALARLLRRQGWGALKERAIRVDVPDYWRLAVVAELLADEGRTAAVEDEAATELAAFLHPSEGGEDGTGWPFGRRVWPSDLLRLLSRIDGVDRIASLEVAPRDPDRSFDAMPAEALICIDPVDIDVRVVPGGTP